MIFLIYLRGKGKGKGWRGGNPETAHCRPIVTEDRSRVGPGNQHIHKATVTRKKKISIKSKIETDTDPPTKDLDGTISK